MVRSGFTESWRFGGQRRRNVEQDAYKYSIIQFKVSAARNAVSEEGKR